MSNYPKATSGVPKTTERKSPIRTIFKISNTCIKFSPCYLYLLFWLFIFDSTFGTVKTAFKFEISLLYAVLCSYSYISKNGSTV